MPNAQHRKPELEYQSRTERHQNEHEVIEIINQLKYLKNRRLKEPTSKDFKKVKKWILLVEIKKETTSQHQRKSYQNDRKENMIKNEDLLQKVFKSYLGNVEKNIPWKPNRKEKISEIFKFSTAICGHSKKNNPRNRNSQKAESKKVNQHDEQEQTSTQDG
jgi:hypothetical protein